MVLSVAVLGSGSIIMQIHHRLICIFMQADCRLEEVGVATDLGTHLGEHIKLGWAPHSVYECGACYDG